MPLFDMYFFIQKPGLRITGTGWIVTKSLDLALRLAALHVAKHYNGKAVVHIKNKVYSSEYISAILAPYHVYIDEEEICFE